MKSSGTTQFRFQQALLDLTMNISTGGWPQQQNHADHNRCQNNPFTSHALQSR
jgi:hypothetical protein